MENLKFKDIRQYRTKLVRKVRCQIFSADCPEIPQAYCRSQFILVRHSFVLGQNPASNAVVLQGISGQYDGKSARRLRAKPSGGLYSVFPKFCLTALCSVSAIFAGKNPPPEHCPFHTWNGGAACRNMKMLWKLQRNACMILKNIV